MIENKKQSQNKAILEHLEAGKTLTAIEALNKFGCFRLAARIKNLPDINDGANDGAKDE